MIDFKKGFRFIFLNITWALISFNVFAFECAGYLAAPTKLASPYTRAIEEYTFPEEANFFVFERIMRIAIHEAHEGIDYYTKQPLAFDEMTLDHIIPRSKNGLDNVFNFVPTNGPTNNQKGSNFVAKDLETLADVRSVYGPRTMALLQHYGAFDNRVEDYEKAKQASYRRKNYRKNRSLDPNLSSALIASKERIIYRRKSMRPPNAVIKLLLAFARELSELSEKEFAEVVAQKTFQFELDNRVAPDIDAEALETKFQVILSHRRANAKVEDESLAVQNTLFEIIDYDLVRRNSRRVVNIGFHPMFALKLLETPVSLTLATDFLESLFRASDISRDEFIEWTE